MSPPSSSRYQVTVCPNRLELQFRWFLQGPAATGRIRAEIPTWVPGDYDFAPFARDVFDLRALTAEGHELSVSRDGWQAWIIDGGEGDVQLSWRVYGYDPDFAEPSGIVDHTYAIVLGARFLHTRAWLGPCTVNYQLPESWHGTLHHPSGAQHVDGNTWEYPSFEILLDTPVAMGDLRVVSRDLNGTPFHFVFVDSAVGFDATVERFVADVLAVANTFHGMFGKFPFEDYSFVLSFNPQAEWGLEHLSSSMCGLGPDVFTDPDQYATGVRVCAHELFHAWNVRRLRPDPLGELATHLASGSFTEGLWVAEGFTRYYEFLSCTRAKVYTPQQFISAVTGYHSHLSAIPAYSRVTAIDSSKASYLNHDPKYPGRCNNAIDYYDKGMLIAFGLDVRLRQAGDSLDVAFAEFYETFQGYGLGHPGYASEQVFDFFERRLAGLGGILRHETKHTAQLNTIALLASLGFAPEHEAGHRLGLMFLDDGEPTIYNVLDDSPAGGSGIAPGDTITSVNGFTYTHAGLMWAANRSESVELRVTRGQRQLCFRIVPAAHKSLKSWHWYGSAEQEALLDHWLGLPLSLKQGQCFPLDFYDNFHGIETIV